LPLSTFRSASYVPAHYELCYGSAGGTLCQAARRCAQLSSKKSRRRHLHHEGAPTKHGRSGRVAISPPGPDYGVHGSCVSHGAGSQAQADIVASSLRQERRIAKTKTSTHLWRGFLQRPKSIVVRTPSAASSLPRPFLYQRAMPRLSPLPGLATCPTNSTIMELTKFAHLSLSAAVT